MRYPVVAGTFYPADYEELKKQISSFFERFEEIEIPEKSIDLTGLIVPHAGYVFSGQTAAYGYYELMKKGKVKTAIIIGPNHTGVGPSLSVYPEGSWLTPFGTIDVDTEISNFILSELRIKGDIIAHEYEHSIEVQLPFLQYLYGNDFKIVPIIMGVQTLEMSKKLSKVIKKFAKDGVVIIASSDLNHYENHEVTLEKGNFIIEALKEKSPEKVYEYIKKYNITACGFGAINTLLYTGFENVRILHHTTSGEIFGDYERTVGYLSAILE
ncbi:putative dioxygenase [Marinitoga piezophila KA3]|uniref:MEMO1 family protein Marpi_1380 n=1 Tax=Marinitoga piezophila (strain DSM 14283 / JCM 11233 / KA3) TaxID=443254 RepID=H2J3G4_MARPK|nr:MULTISPECIES: AmmeMemoRadiSam system protein B [Marinitoga]AEX85780.1 putative dioxygenase [Marinitoga piezophila KA3]APT76222.1 dioxygenase [Marinitoga sp. 1137]